MCDGSSGSGLHQIPFINKINQRQKNPSASSLLQILDLIHSKSLFGAYYILGRRTKQVWPGIKCACVFWGGLEACLQKCVLLKLCVFGRLKKHISKLNKLFLICVLVEYRSLGAVKISFVFDNLYTPKSLVGLGKGGHPTFVSKFKE